MTINPAALTITADNKSKTYGDANPTLTASYTGLKGTDTSSVVSGLTLNTTATTSSNAGTYTITAADDTAANYTITYEMARLPSILHLRLPLQLPLHLSRQLHLLYPLSSTCIK